MVSRRIFALTFGFWLLLIGALAAQTVGGVGARLSSRFLVRGEQALLEVTLLADISSEPDAFPRMPSIPGVSIAPAQMGTTARRVSGRVLEYAFQYTLSSYEVGRHTIPPIEVSVGGTTAMTEPVEFVIFNPDELKWQEATVGGYSFRYAGAFCVMNERPYVGEAVATELKIYVPQQLVVADWGVPEFERDGVTSWRFEPATARGQINLLGARYSALAYPSTLSPVRTGEVAIGPADVRLTTVQTARDGFLRSVNHQIHLVVEPLKLEAQPLPEGAPEGFENAIGNFSLNVDVSDREVVEGDPISVDIVVSGTGNLDTLRAPTPVEQKGWKLYDAASDERGDARREVSGTVFFRQFMRPLELKSAVPAFRLVYFDPEKEVYQTALSAPIPLQMTPAPREKLGEAVAPDRGPVPVERMTDILGLVSPSAVSVSEEPLTSGLWLHLVAALVVLALLGRIVWLNVAPRWKSDPEQALKKRELSQLSREKDGRAFLRQAGSFVERWLGRETDPAVLEVLQERDTHCFRGESYDVQLEPKRRDQIVRLLRRSALVWLVGACVLLGATAEAPAVELPDRLMEQAATAYDEARYQDAIRLWLSADEFGQLSADVLYNIGNACYRMGSSGQAALYYRRALAREPGHMEASQNLRFIERKEGSISVQRPEYQDALSVVPLQIWKGSAFTAAWLLGICLLVFPATQTGSRWRPIAVVGLVLAPLLAAMGVLGWWYFPDDAKFARPARQAVVVADDTALFVDASRTSPEVIDAPPGSLCEVIRQSGQWVYVGFATGTRGWVPLEAIERVLPTSPPEVPAIRKPTGDGRSA